ncbi:FAD/NAD(P)-binding domain-containing protein [Aspergillus sclerotioniger CBS 115572]|uniref:FAD/NAD(P)-binding domain-containing protein n=1 Tax=Aspergillus sclerotioniger CBS 115572 TaxID=1450535 RepID=A0A317UXM7_9EURO|nr:FAD/NAD(P)-binding domain-containing protein [Aspergillus sclerotioniger CBS 115572]PWY66793.1 FAD/NAD(P)-binding domain-containing protein [Aspergillus sclerotioniger CBS 115572]
MADGTHHINSHPVRYDIVIVGAGFSGIFLLYHLRKLGYSCRIYDSGSDLGGTWAQQTYPGLRVDSESWVYQFSIPEVWEDWSWSELYPSGQELRRYFAHVEKKLHIKQDVEFQTRVVNAQFYRETSRWRIETQDGRIIESQFLLPCVGIAAKRYTPDFPGVEHFQGAIYHSAHWPREGVNVQGKKVAVLGTGSTGVQIIQEWAREADTLTVFQRTPNLALPMRQIQLPRDQGFMETLYPHVFRDREKTLAGIGIEAVPKRTLDASPEEREALYEVNWRKGGFNLIIGSYIDSLLDPQANRLLYDFWANKTRPRIHDPKKRDLLAPLIPPHPFGAKRGSLEVVYFEAFNQPNVHLVNLREEHIVEFKPHGIVTSSGAYHELDAVAFATGFDGVTGPLISLGLRNTEGVSLEDEWKSGAKTYLGMTINGYPNMFYMYGVHAPAALSNGPTGIEMQGRMIIDVIQRMRANRLSSIEATPEAADAWTKRVDEISNATLFSKADSWYMGANIPGKARQMLNFCGGLPAYEQACTQALSNWEGFRTIQQAHLS